MKKIFFTTILFLSVVCVKAQKILDISDITVNGVALLNQNKSVLIKNFGQPNSIESDELADSYKYDGLHVRVNKNNIIRFIEITKNTYSFTPFNIRLGDDIQEVEKKIKLEAMVGTDNETPDNSFGQETSSFVVYFDTKNNREIINITVHL